MAAGDPWGEYSPERVERVLQTRVVGYELWTLASTARRLAGDPTDHAVLESFLLHTRCLAEFFVGREREPHDSDVVPSAFLPDWHPAPPDAVAILDDVIPLLDKHLSHMTSARQSLFGPRWDVASLETAVFAIADAFGDALAQHDPDRHREYASWLKAASAERPSRRPQAISTTETLLNPGRPDLRRSPIDVVQVVPVCTPEAVWGAWIGRYMADRRINWPTQ